MMGGADCFVRDRVKDFRAAAIAQMSMASQFNLATLAAEQKRLAARLQAYGDCRDATEIWRKAGITDPASIADVSEEVFASMPRLKEAAHDAR